MTDHDGTAGTEDGTADRVVPVPPQGGYVDHQCEVRAWKDHHPDYADVERVEPGPADLRRMEEGNVYEASVEQQLSDLLDHSTSLFLPSDGLDDEGRRLEADKANREAATVEAMSNGVLFIWNARLPADKATSRISEPDALVRVGKAPKKNGKWAYAAIDVKHHKTFTESGDAVTWPVSQLSDPRREAAVELSKWPGKPQESDSRQLCHYHRHLETLGFAQEGGEIWGGIIGKENVVIWRDLAAPLYRYGKVSALELYDEAFARRVDVISAALNGADVGVQVEKKTECSGCPWRENCSDELAELDHITLLYTITPTKARAHYQVGVTTRAELAKLDHRTAVAVDAGVHLDVLIPAARAATDLTLPVEEIVAPGRSKKSQLRKLGEAGLVTVGDVATLHDPTAQYAGTKVSNLAGAIDQARVFRAQKVHLRRGQTALEVPRGDVELHVDMENDPGGIVSLWGTLLVVRNGGLNIPGPAYRPFGTFEADDDAGEAEAFAGLWQWICTLQTLCDHAGLALRAYYYTPAENRCMRHLATKHAGVRGVPSIDEVEDFIESETWVDLHAIVKGSLLWPIADTSLKSVAGWARFSWRDSDPSGDNSVVWYHQAVSDPDEAVRDEARQRFLEYNEDDVRATAHILDWLEMLTSARKVADRIPNVAVLDRRFGPRTPTRRKAA